MRDKECLCAQGQAGQNRLREHAPMTEAGQCGQGKTGGSLHTSLRSKGSGEPGPKGRESKAEAPRKAQEAKEGQGNRALLQKAENLQNAALGEGDRT